MKSESSCPYNGPKNRLSKEIDKQKYRQTGENFYSKCVRIADALKDTADHLRVLIIASEYVDSAVSKTWNVGEHVTYHDFKSVYYKAWKGGCKGITTFCNASKRKGVLNEANDNKPRAEACFINRENGKKECD